MSEKKSLVRELTREEMDMIVGGSVDKKIIILYCDKCNKNVPCYVFSEKTAICSVCKKVVPC